MICDVQPVDRHGNVAPVLASSLSPHVPDYIVISEDEQEPQSIGQYPYQVKMIGLSCPESISELQGVPDCPGFRAPELLLEGQLSPKGDVWSLGCFVGCQRLALCNPS